MTMDADGTGATVVEQRFDYISGVSWSPNGARLAYCASRHGGEIRLFTERVGGGLPRRLATQVDDNCRPSWSPDGSEIAFGRGGQLTTVHPDGTGLKVIVGGFDQDADWSPDGSHLVFARYVHGAFDLYTVRPDGSELTQITDTRRRWEFTPAYSPTGTRIVFARSQLSFESSADDLWVMNADGTGPTRLTNTPHRDEYFPSWQPT